MEYLKENDDYFDPIIYTSGLKPYTDRLLNIVDPNREVFKHQLHQNACYIFEIREEKILFLIDIGPPFSPRMLVVLGRESSCSIRWEETG